MTPESLLRNRFVAWLRSRIPASKWEQAWWLAPALALAILPIGFAGLFVLELIGWAGTGRAGQGLALLALLSGPIVGLLILWSIREAGLKTRSRVRAEWLARFAILGPLLTLLILFWLVRFFHGD